MKILITGTAAFTPWNKIEDLTQSVISRGLSRGHTLVQRGEICKRNILSGFVSFAFSHFHYLYPLK
jgi:hypothetical protein